MSERDNTALAERTAMVEQLGTLLHAVNDAAVQQRAAIDALVGSAARVLEQAGVLYVRAPVSGSTVTAEQLIEHLRTLLLRMRHEPNHIKTSLCQHAIRLCVTLVNRWQAHR